MKKSNGTGQGAEGEALAVIGVLVIKRMALRKTISCKKRSDKEMSGSNESRKKYFESLLRKKMSDLGFQDSKIAIMHKKPSKIFNMLVFKLRDNRLVQIF